MTLSVSLEQPQIVPEIFLSTLFLFCSLSQVLRVSQKRSVLHCIGEREKVLRLQEKVYVDMKAAICRQPGPEVSEQLAVYQQVLKEKAKQLKVPPTDSIRPRNTFPVYLI